MQREDWKVKELQDNNVYSKYIEKAENLIAEHRFKIRSRLQEEAKTRLGDLYEPYSATLNFVQGDTLKMRNYIESHRKELSPRQYHYHMRRCRDYLLHDFYIKRVDNGNRIYTILTQTPSRKHSLLQFVNIKFEVDLSNCHPLLFDIILKTYYKKVSYEPYKTLLEPMMSCISEVSKLPKRLSEDMKDYISLTESGIFWDTMLEKYGNCDRKEIKKNMFAEVFYSKAKKRIQDYEYACDFQERFPHVYKIIKASRRINDTYLCNLLVQIESDIIQSTLRVLYKEGFAPLNIHDAIVILDIQQNKGLSEGHVKKVLLRELQKRGIQGHAKIEYPTNPK